MLLETSDEIPATFLVVASGAEEVFEGEDISGGVSGRSRRCLFQAKNLFWCGGRRFLGEGRARYEIAKKTVSPVGRRFRTVERRVGA